MVTLRAVPHSQSRLSYDSGLSGHFEPLSPIASSIDSTSSIHPNQNGSAEDHSKSRDERLCRLFELEDEHCKDFFLCAYSAKNGWFLVQGLLYVFERHICFFSNLFGIETQKVIPLEQVEQVSKTKNLGLPNSITVVNKDGTTTSFTSFLSRRAAFDAIVDSLQHARTTPPNSPEPRLPTGRKTKVSIWGRHWERKSNLPRVASAGKLKRTRSIENALASRNYDQDSVWAAVAEASGSMRKGHHQRNSSRGSSHAHQRNRSQLEQELGEWEDDVLLQGGAGDQLALGDEEGEEEGEEEEEVPQPSPFAAVEAQLKVLVPQCPGEAPPPPEGYAPLADFTISGTTPSEVAAVLLAEEQDTSAFVLGHLAQGHRKAVLGEEGWQEGANMSEHLQGWVRHFEFETRKLGKWTRCVQQQHCCSYQGGTTIFCTQQKMPDLSMFPMGKIGDQFSVETHWTIRPAPPALPASTPPSTPPATPPGTPRPAPATHISIVGTVRFFSHASAALPKGVITSQATSELRDWYTKFLPFIETLVRQASSSSSSSPPTSPTSPAALPAASAPQPPLAATSGPQLQPTAKSTPVPQPRPHPLAPSPASAPSPQKPRPPTAASDPIPHSPAIHPLAPPPALTLPATPTPSLHHTAPGTPQPPGSTRSTGTSALRTPLPALWRADPSTEPAPRSWTPPPTTTATTARGLVSPLPGPSPSMSQYLMTGVRHSGEGVVAGLRLGQLLSGLLLLAINLLLLRAVWDLQAQVSRLEARLPH